ncbi:MAG: hypothetical protein K9I74_13020 [Bacteroidales bacterium]|nr:hypothetical protein [Bacteroidales bacterium]
MRKGTLYIVLLLFCHVTILSAWGQSGVESTVLERYRLYRTYDSLRQLPEESRSAEEIKQTRQKLKELDRFLPGTYIPAGDTNISRQLLIKENNRIKAENEQYHSRMIYLYIGGGLLLLLAIIFVTLFVVNYRKYRLSKSEVKKLNNIIDENRERNKKEEDNEDNVVEELRREIKNYKDELTKASDFIVNLRNEKIRLDSDLEEYKAELNTLRDKKNKLEKKAQTSDQENQKNFDELNRQKQEAEENYNRLYQDYQKLEKEHREMKEKIQSVDENIRKEQRERETVREELMGWIESKNEEIQSMKKSKVKNERNLKELRETISSLLKKELNLDNPLSKRANLDMNDHENMGNNLKTVMKNKDDEIAMLQKEKEDLNSDKKSLENRIEELEQDLKSMKNDLSDKDELLSEEFKKRRDLEDQLQNMLKNLKNY